VIRYAGKYSIKNSKPGVLKEAVVELALAE
jgi:hypothetical protein